MRRKFKWRDRGNYMVHLYHCHCCSCFRFPFFLSFFAYIGLMWCWHCSVRTFKYYWLYFVLFYRSFCEFLIFLRIIAQTLCATITARTATGGWRFAVVGHGSVLPGASSSVISGESKLEMGTTELDYNRYLYFRSAPPTRKTKLMYFFPQELLLVWYDAGESTLDQHYTLLWHQAYENIFLNSITNVESDRLCSALRIGAALVFLS